MPENVPDMTLRDWFAGQIAAALVKSYEPHQYTTDKSIDDVAVTAYRFADRMMEARRSRDEAA